MNEKEERRDEITFHKFGELAKKHPELVKRRPFKTYSEDEPIKEPWYKDLVFNVSVIHTPMETFAHVIVMQYHQVSPDELPSGFQYGSSYESYTLNSPRYIGHLSKELRSKGVQIVRRAISHVDEPWSLYPEASVVINATALGSRTLGGVEDPDVYPARGQTVLVKAPKAQSYCGVKRSWTEKVRTYVIPRPGPEGHVILGGTVERDEYSTKADMEIAERILKNAHAVCPELSEGRGSSWKDIEVVSHQAGLRPMRKGGMRLEVEHREVEVDGAHGVNGVSGEESNGVSGRRRKPCIHAYGVGPAG